MLRVSPGDDLMLPDSHHRCQLGTWLERERAALEAFDAAITGEVLALHHMMHDAVRAMCIAVLDGTAARPADLETFERSQSAMVGSLGRMRERITADAAHLDPLTGLPLRNGLAHAFEIRQRDARRARGALYLAMIDVDHFKRINDSLGHLVGDRALEHIAAQLSGALRQSDIVFRYGGEEFLALLISADPRGAEVAAARLAEAVRVSPLEAAGQNIALSVTVGLARVRDDESLLGAISRADDALLDGKRAGRDRVVIASEPPPNTD